MKKIAYHQFSERLYQSAKKEHLPLRVMFELTYRCNFRCGHCYVPASFRKAYQKKELSTDRVCRILEQLKEAGCLYLGFTGGEVFLRKDILDILSFAQQCGFITTINTNGSLIKAGAAKHLSCLGVSKVDMTLPAVTEAVFHKVTVTKGARNLVFGALRLLRKNGLSLGLKSCVLENNFGEIKKIQALAKQLGIFLRLDDTLFPKWDADCKPFLLRRKLSTANRLPETSICFKQSKSALKTKEVFFCGAGLTQAAITPAGELKFCLDINYPKFDILKMGFKRAWRQLNTLASFVKIDKQFECDACVNQPHCAWCPGYSWIMTKTFTKCPKLNELYQA